MESAGGDVKQAVVDALREEFGERLRCVVLYGSRARGNATESSDWDFLVVAEGLPDHRIKRLRTFKPMKSGMYREFGERVHVAPYTPDEVFHTPTNPLLYGVLTGYEVLHGEEQWEELVDELRPVIKQRKPTFTQGGREWQVAELV